MGMNCKPRCGKIVVMVILGVAVLGGVVMALWNWLMPELFFGAKEISYVQALGILVLSKILFGGLRGGGHGRWHRDRWERMTPEEREKFQAGTRGCFGRDEPKADEPKVVEP
jgi:hypothetical protein